MAKTLMHTAQLVPILNVNKAIVGNFKTRPCFMTNKNALSANHLLLWLKVSLSDAVGLFNRHCLAIKIDHQRMCSFEYHGSCLQLTHKQVSCFSVGKSFSKASLPWLAKNCKVSSTNSLLGDGVIPGDAETSCASQNYL